MYQKIKVLCAMSGGVDSSVAAALLKKEGYDVIGIFMKFWSEPSFSKETKDTFSAAREVTDILNIPLFIADFQKEFKKKIVDNFLKEYSIGKTPNPCIRCNQFIKLGLFFNKMKKYDARYIATGHYARIIFSKKTKFKLLRGKDKNKDQSYFLYNLTQEKLKKLLFPVGRYTKLEVRELAKKFRLPVHQRKESQEVCFVGGKDHYDFLRRYLKSARGDIFTVDGKKIGEHHGLPFYTIGQRRGIKIGGTGPYYVVKLDFQHNRLIVSCDKKHPALLQNSLICKDVNWTSGQIPKIPLSCKAKSRYGQQEAEAKVSFYKNSKKYLVKFKKPQFAITSGQSVVFYKGDEVLGGGIIENI